MKDFLTARLLLIKIVLCMTYLFNGQVIAYDNNASILAVDGSMLPLLEDVIQAYKAKDVNLNHFKVDYASERCVNNIEMRGIYKGYAILNSYYYLAGLKYLKESYRHFRYPTEWHSNGKSLSFATILSKPLVSLIKKTFQKNLKSVNNDDIKYMVMFLEQLDIYYDLFNTHANEGIIKQLTNTEFFALSGNSYDVNFQTLGFPKPKNICFWELPYLQNIKVKNQRSTYYTPLSLEGYFFTFWLRRHHEGNMALVKEILDFVLPLLKQRQLTTEVPQEIIQESPKNNNIAQLLEDVIQAYKAKDINLDHLKMKYASERCLQDTEMQNIYKGYATLISYYYIAGLKYLKAPYSQFSYPTKWNYQHYQNYDEKSLSFAKILSKSVASLIIKKFQENLKIINKNDIKDIVIFLEQLDVYYDVFNTYTNKSIIERLNTSYVDIKTLGLPTPQNTCFWEPLYLMNIKVKNQRSTYYTPLSLEGYFFSFWLRRHNEGNTALVKEILDVILPLLKSR